jgi:hypothetical protein
MDWDRDLIYDTVSKLLVDKDNLTLSEIEE